jgi:hypothetical protein
MFEERGGGRSIGIVRSRTKAMEFFFLGACGKLPMIETQVFAGQKFSWWPWECQWLSALRETFNFDEWRKRGACTLCCAKWRTKEYSGEISGCRNNSWKRSHYFSQRLENALALTKLGSKNDSFWTQRITNHGFGAFSYSPDLSPSDFSLFTQLKRFLKKNKDSPTPRKSMQERRKQWQGNWKVVSENAFQSFTKTKTKQKQTNSMVWVRERTITTELPPLVGEVISNFCG